MQAYRNSLSFGLDLKTRALGPGLEYMSPYIYKGLLLELPSGHVMVSTVNTFLSALFELAALSAYISAKKDGWPAQRVSRLTSHHIMLTCPSSLHSPSRYKRQNSNSIHSSLAIIVQLCT